MFFHAWEALAVNTLSPGLQLLSSLLYVIDMSAFTDLEPDTDTNKQLKATDNNFRRDSRNCGGLFFSQIAALYPGKGYMGLAAWILFWHASIVDKSVNWS